MSNVDVEMLRRQLDRIEASGHGKSMSGGNGSPPRDGDSTWRMIVDTRLAQIDGALVALKTSEKGRSGSLV